jgi:hypothetical protein
LLVAFGFWHARRTPGDQELALHTEIKRELVNA